MYKKNLAMRAGVVVMTGALTFGSMPINVFADVQLVESEASSRYDFDNSVVTGKVIIDGVTHYIDSGKFNFTLSGSNGIVGIDESFLDREDDSTNIVTYSGKTYKIPNISATINGTDSWMGYQDDIYGTVISGYDPDATYTVEFTYELEEIVTSKALDVSVESDAWKYFSYGTWKNLNVKVNDNMTALSKDSATNITFSDGDVVKVLAGDSYELWTGTVSVNGSNVYFTGNSSAKSYECNLVYADGVVSFKKLSDTGWGGAEGGVASTSTFTYDFTAKADDDSPIAGISVTDDTAVPFYDWFRSGFESGKEYTWGTGNSYTYTRDDGDGTGTVTCSTDATGHTDMLVPIKNQSVINEYGANQFMSGNLQLQIWTATPYSVSGNVYAGNGLIDFDTDSVVAGDEKGRKQNQTLDSLGVSTSLEKLGTSTVLGDYYQVIEASNRADTVIIKDTFGNEIGTVTMSVDSTDYLTDIDGTYSLVGKNKKGSVVPKATITMAEGVTDWRVSAEYETDASDLYAGTFHITATKTNKADISVYDVYGASVDGNSVDVSDAVTVARFEEDYIEPNSSIEVSNKGEQTVDGVSYSPIVGEDLTVASKMRSVSSRIDAVTSDSVDVDIEPNGSYAVYFYYSSPKEAPKTYNLKVIDVYGSEEVVRDTKTVASGYAYSYDKNEKGTWKVTGTDSYAGTVTEDTTLYFYYTQPSVTEQVTIKVYDHFGETVEERVNKTVDKGTSYTYKSLSRDTWKVTGETHYNGVANKDVELHFYYALPDEPTPTPDPEPTPTPDPEPTPEIPSTPEPTPAPSQPSEPKTGETSSPYGALSLASILAFVVALTKKRK